MDNNSNSNQSNQSRFLIAMVLSMAVLLGWSYFFIPKKPPTDDAIANTAANTNQTAPVPAPQPTATQVPAPQQQQAATTPDTTANRTITIKKPFYEGKLDSRGALAARWVSGK